MTSRVVLFVPCILLGGASAALLAAAVSSRDSKMSLEQVGLLTLVLGSIATLLLPRANRPWIVLGAWAFSLVFALSALALASRHQDPLLVAEEGPATVRIALLKGFSGTVHYLGSDGDFAFFALGDVVWSYHKVRSCDVRLLRTFPLKQEKPLVVTDPGRVDFGGCLRLGSAPGAENE